MLVFLTNFAKNFERFGAFFQLVSNRRAKSPPREVLGQLPHAIRHRKPWPAKDFPRILCEFSPLVVSRGCLAAIAERDPYSFRQFHVKDGLSSGGGGQGGSIKEVKGRPCLFQLIEITVWKQERKPLLLQWKGERDLFD